MFFAGYFLIVSLIGFSYDYISTAGSSNRPLLFGDRVTRTYNKINQTNDGETTWTNTETTRSGRGKHKNISLANVRTKWSTCVAILM